MTAESGGDTQGPSFISLNRWRIAAMVVLAVVGIYALIRALEPDDNPSDQDAAEATTTQVQPPPPVTTLAPIATTAATTAAPTTTSTSTTTSTTSTTSTTTSTTTTTTTTTQPPPSIAVVGEPLAPDNLTLSILGIGPLDFGDDADAVLGRLAATFGQPDADSGPVTDGDFGTCSDGTYRVVYWGALAVITRFALGNETFDAFKIDLRIDGDPGPGAQLQTLSGFVAGATIGELEAIYIPGFRIAYSTHPVEGEIYELSSNQGLLLWGPITSRDDSGIVEGVFSAGAC